MKMWLLAVWITAAWAGEVHVRQAGFRGPHPEGWRTWSARPEIAPRTFIDGVRYRTAPGALAISGNSNPAAAGGWEYAVSGIGPGSWYRLQAHYRTEGVRYDALQVLARLDWVEPGGKRAGQPEFAWLTEPVGDWKRVTLEAPAPQKASAVKIQLYLLNAPQGTVWWDDISFDSIGLPGPRHVKVAAINFRPNGSQTPAENLRKFEEAIDASVRGASDVIVLPEGITVVGTGKKYADVAETIPGPSTDRLGDVARRRKSWIVAGIYEREGSAIYNTAVLIDRAGSVAGKYRKVYLPREEVEGGLTPGMSYPVFTTDFGKIGIMICWDLQYTDPARALALKGAELILMPIWGGNTALGKARAIENHVFLASSGYDYPTQILDPDGETVAVATERGSAAVATVDLARRYVDPWLGEMRGRLMKELRRDVTNE